jgi:hypothetical protein
VDEASQLSSVAPQLNSPVQLTSSLFLPRAQNPAEHENHNSTFNDSSGGINNNNNVRRLIYIHTVMISAMNPTDLELARVDYEPIHGTQYIMAFQSAAIYNGIF